MFARSPVVIEGREQFQVAAAEQSEPLASGVYDVWAEADAYIKVSIAADDVSETTGYYVPAGAIISVRVGRDGLCIGSTAAIAVHRIG